MRSRCAARRRARCGSPPATSPGCCWQERMYGAPHDLLADALDVRPGRLRAITSRWRRATWRCRADRPGTGWCWLTRAGMRTARLRFPARRWAGWRISARAWPCGCLWNHGEARRHDGAWRCRRARPLLSGPGDPARDRTALAIARPRAISQEAGKQCFSGQSGLPGRPSPRHPGAGERMPPDGEAGRCQSCRQLA
jgi:hypothetical protein